MGLFAIDVTLADVGANRTLDLLAYSPVMHKAVASIELSDSFDAQSVVVYTRSAAVTAVIPPLPDKIPCGDSYLTGVVVTTGAKATGPGHVRWWYHGD